MKGGEDTVLWAVCAAVTAALLFGVASVLEQRNAKKVRRRGPLSPRLMVDLLKRPAFIGALGVNAAGSALQVVGLHLGSLAVVQPLIVLNLLFAVVIAAATIRHRPPDRTMLAGTVCCAAGIGSFLAIARPGGGSATIGTGAAIPVSAGLAGALAVCLAGAGWGPPSMRPLWLALACGIDFGVNAFLLKVIPSMLRQGFAEPGRQWPLYLLVIVAPAGFILNQNAFQAGTLIAPVLAVITTADPLVSVTLGRLLLHETIAGSATDIAAEAVALAVMTGGVVALAYRAPQLTAETRRNSEHARRRGSPAPGADRQR